MSNERIEKILNEHDLDCLNTEMSSFHQKIYSRTVKAMEQYGKEQYEQGRLDTENVENYKLTILTEEITRLRSLVQAQKELIEFMADRYAETLPKAVSCGYIEEYDTTMMGVKLKLQIKELEACKESYSNQK